MAYLRHYRSKFVKDLFFKTGNLYELNFSFVPKCHHLA